MTSRSNWLRLSSLAWAYAVFVTIGCGELTEIPRGACGNGVREPGEDCDTYAGSNQVCNASCLFECNANGTPGCPDGAVCGTDGICHFNANCSDDKCRYLSTECDATDLNCRLSASSYVPFGPVLPVAAQSVMLGDFNGDRLQDLLTLGDANQLWQSYPRIQFLNPEGQLKNVFDPRIPMSSPSIVTLGKKNPRHQVVFTSPFGIGTFDVATDESVLPIAYPIQQMTPSLSYRMALLKGTTAKPYGESVILFMNQTDSTNPMGIITVTSDVDETLAPMPQSPLNLLGNPISANVIGGPDSPCDELLLTFGGDSHVYLLSPCDSAGNLISQSEPPGFVLSLEGGHAMGKMPLVGFFDKGSATLDLLLADEAGNIYVSFGDGKGNFSADPSNPSETVGKAWPIVLSAPNDCVLPLPLDREFPLAVGDINGDGVTDWVSSNGVHLTQSVTIEPEKARVAVEACTVKMPFVGTWSNAKIADFNQDGFLDVVAGSYDEQSTTSQRSELDFIAGTGTNLVNSSVITTKGPPRQIVSGDFDGDGVNDVAFTESVLPDSQLSAGSSAAIATERLAIAFGNHAGPPSPPAEIGEFSSVKQLLAGKYAGDDAIDELGVIAEPSDASGQQLSVFIGTSSRHPFAPLGLASYSPDEISQIPLASAVGMLSLGATPRPSIISAAIGCDDPAHCESRIWIVPGNAAGGFDAPIPSLPIDNFVPFNMNRGQMGVALAVSDPEDSSSNAEAYALTSAQSDGSTVLWRINLPNSNGPWTDAPVEKIEPPIKGQLSVNSKPTLLDLDDDGFQDLALILVDGAGRKRLCILWNDRGNLKGPESCVDEIAIDASALQSTTGFAVRRSEPSIARSFKVPASLVAVTTTGVFAVVVPKQGDRATLSVTRLDELPSGMSIDVGDITGDGLRDFAIAVPGGVQLMKERACSDADCLVGQP